VIILDASVLIAHFESADANHDRADELLTEAVDEPLGASPITLAEVLVGPARSDRLDATERMLEDLGVTPIPIVAGAPARLARMRATLRLPLPDCCVLLAAETATASLATFDKRLSQAATAIGITAVS
jgi:predicted nucleic acid-binding protein